MWGARLKLLLGVFIKWWWSILKAWRLKPYMLGNLHPWPTLESLLVVFKVESIWEPRLCPCSWRPLTFFFFSWMIGLQIFSYNLHRKSHKCINTLWASSLEIILMPQKVIPVLQVVCNIFDSVKSLKMTVYFFYFKNGLIILNVVSWFQ